MHSRTDRQGCSRKLLASRPAAVGRPRANLQKRRRTRKPSQLAFTADHSASTVSSILQSLLTLYCLLIMTLGVVVPISDALAKPVEHADYRQLFYIYLHTVGIVSIVYINTLISRHSGGSSVGSNPQSSEASSRPASSALVVSVLLHAKEHEEEKEDVVEEGATPAESSAAAAQEEPSSPTTASPQHRSQGISRLGILGRRLRNRLVRRNRQNLASQAGVAAVDLKVFVSTIGVNLYLRFGAILFGFGVMVHTGFKITDVLSKRGSLKCAGPLFLPKHIIDLLFIVLQTYFLFKHHRVTINTRKSLVRFFLVHLAVTNVCIWMKTVIYEIKASLLHSSTFKKLPKVGNSSGYYGNLTYDAAKLSNYSSSGRTMFNRTAAVLCTDQIIDDDAMSVKLGVYLYPCAVEYGLICAAICYKFFTNVGNTDAVPYGRKSATAGPRTTRCHKSHRGLLVGLAITICVLVPMISLLVMQRAIDSSHRDVHITAMLTVECLVLCCTTAMALAGTATAVRRLRPCKLEHHEAFDVNLLFFGLAGTICYNLFVAISVGACMVDTAAGSEGSLSCQWGGSYRQSLITKLTGLRSFTDVLQSLAQTMYVMQAIQRRVTPDLVERMQKPGRGLTTALLIVNLAMWIASVFEVQRSIGENFLDFYFGPMPWEIIKSMFQPLIIFYRFHSTVCLSEIWVHSYRLPRLHKHG